MERLTEKHYLGTDHYMKCSGNCNVDMDCIDCPSFDCLVERLAAYEDTGLTPEEVFALIKGWSDLCTTIGECGGIDRLRELAEADKGGLLVGHWVLTDEKLPPEGQDVLCWYEYFRYGAFNRMYQTYGIGFQFNGNWGGEVANGRSAKVLAWMPLPEPPEEK